MKRLLTLFLAISILWLPMEARRRWVPSVAAVAATYLLTQDFESGSIPAGWTSTNGTPIYNYATAPAPLVGSFSLECANNTDTATGPVFAAQSDVWFFAAVALSSYANTPDVFFGQSSGGAVNALRVRVIDATTIRIYNGTVTSNATFATVANTKFYIWAHYTKGTGTNGQAELYLSLTTTKPGSPSAMPITTGDANVTITQFQTANNASTLMIYDYLRVSSSVIGSAPP